MNWLMRFIRSSVGKKSFMAVTGLCFIAFLCIHLAGNLSLYGGEIMFSAYVAHLHSLGVLIHVAEWCLLTLAVVHVFTGTVLFFQNLAARPVRYVVNKSAGGRTLGSRTMPYTGFVILAFVVFHLIDFHFVDKTHTTVYQIVAASFSKPLYVLIYIAAVSVVGLHVRHGFWSLFQTLGAHHAKYMPAVMVGSLVLGLIFGIGFGMLPLYMALAV